MGVVGKRGKVVQVLLNAAAECDRGSHQERWVQQKKQNNRNRTQTERARLDRGRQGVGLQSRIRSEWKKESREPTREGRAGR